MYNKPEKELELLEKQKAQISALIESEKALLLSMMQHMLKVWQRILKQRERQKMVCSPLKLVAYLASLSILIPTGIGTALYMLPHTRVGKAAILSGPTPEEI